MDYLCAFTPTTLNGWFLFLVWYFVRSFVLLLSFVETLVCEKAREKKRREGKRTRKVKWLHCTKTAFKLNFQREKDSFHCIWIQSDCWENDFSHSAKFYIKFDRRIYSKWKFVCSVFEHRQESNRRKQEEEEQAKIKSTKNCINHRFNCMWEYPKLK